MPCELRRLWAPSGTANIPNIPIKATVAAVCFMGDLCLVSEQAADQRKQACFRATRGDLSSGADGTRRRPGSTIKEETRTLRTRGCEFFGSGCGNSHARHRRSRRQRVKSRTISLHVALKPVVAFLPDHAALAVPIG
jgi:hypothetical protein